MASGREPIGQCVVDLRNSFVRYWLTSRVHDAAFAKKRALNFVKVRNLVRSDRVVMLNLKRNLVVAMAGIAFVSGIVGLIIKPSIYTAAALISIDAGSPSSYPTPPDGRRLTVDQAILDRIGSSELIDETVDRFGLASHRTSTPLDDDQGAAIAAVRNGLHIARTASQGVWRLTYSSPQPALAAGILDDLLDNVVSADAALRAQAQSAERAFIGDLRSTSEQTHALRARIQAARNDLDLQRAADVKQLKALQEPNASVDRRPSSPAAPNASDIGPAAHADDKKIDLAQLRAERNALAHQQTELSRRYGPRYPLMIGLARQISQLDLVIGDQSRLESASQGVAAASAVQAARLRLLDAARSLVASQTRQALFLEAVDHQLDGIEKSNGAVLSHYLQAAPPEVLQISVLRHPTSPQFPDRSIVRTLISIVTLLAALIGVADLVMRARRRGGLETAKDVEQRLRLPVVATIPRLLASNKPGGGARVTEGRPADVMLTAHDPAFVESFEVLQRTLGITGGVSRPLVIAICSALPNEGKTTISACLARLVAKTGKKVVLIDCDGRRRALSRLLVDADGPGLVQWARGDANLQDVLSLDPLSGVNLIKHSSTEQIQDFSTPALLDRLLKTLRPDFDVIILDTGPVLALTEARVIAALADQVVLVARWRTTPVKAVRLAIALLGEAGAAIKGVALSLADPPRRTVDVAAS